MTSSKSLLLGLVPSEIETTDVSYSIKGFKIPPMDSISKTETQTPPSSLFIFKNPELNIADYIPVNPLDGEPLSEDRLALPPKVMDEGNITVTLVTASKSVATDKKQNTDNIIKNRKDSKKSDNSSSKSKQSTKRSRLSPKNLFSRLTTPKEPQLSNKDKYYETVKEAILSDQTMRQSIFQASVNDLNNAADKLLTSLSPRKASKQSLHRKASMTSKSSTKSKAKNTKSPKSSNVSDKQESSHTKSKKRAAKKSDTSSVRKGILKVKEDTTLKDPIPEESSDVKNFNKENDDPNAKKNSSSTFDIPSPEVALVSSLVPLPKKNSNEGSIIDAEQSMVGDNLRKPSSNTTSQNSPLIKTNTASSLGNASSIASGSSMKSRNSRVRKSSSTSSTRSKTSKVKEKNKDKKGNRNKPSPTSSIHSKSSRSSRKSRANTKGKVLKKHFDNNSNKKDKKQPQVHELLSNCESYMNWSHRIFSNDALKHYISDIELTYLEPPPSGEFIKTEVLRYDSFQCVANLGALCFFQIEFNQFQAAKETIDKTKEFVDECVQKGFLRKEQIYSLDYVWDFLRLYASKREWDMRNQFKYFPEMNLYGFTQNLEALKPKVKAGIYGLKAYYLSMIAASFDSQVEALRQAIIFDHECYEWHCCLQKVLRQRRKSNAKQSPQPKLNYSMDDELQESWTAVKLAPNHPRCILGAMQVLADIASVEEYGFKWNPITFGLNKFYNMASVVKYLKEEAKKVTKHVPQSLDPNLILADLFLTQLPKHFRDTKLGKECLDRALLHHPESAKANLRIAQFHLNVANNYSEAELYFDTAFSLDCRNYTALTGLLYSMMRTMVKRQDVILDVIKKQMKKSHWSQKQLATLRYLRGLTLFGASKASEAFEEFLRAYKMDEGSIAFHELPEIHKHFGWPGWPATTVLNFGNIRIEAEVFKEELLNSSHDADGRILSSIIKAINKADDIEKQRQRSRKKHLSKSSVLSTSTRGSSVFK